LALVKVAVMVRVDPVHSPCVFRPLDESQP
jgi:hypothetical protein